MHKFSLAAVTIGLLLAFSADAQAPPSPTTADGTPTRVRGTIEKVDGQTLTVNSRDGQQVTIGLQPNFTVLGVAKRNLGHIKEGDYVASTSVKGTDGHLHALEIHIFPKQCAGLGKVSVRPIWRRTA